MKAKLMTCAAGLAIAGFAAPALAADQTPSAPAGTEYAPKPTVEEELVYLRDIVALQTLRLDQAEQTLAKQNKVIEQQQSQINSLQTMVGAMGAHAGTMAAGAAGGYVVKSGDTLGKIAKNHGVSIETLAAANELHSPYPLNIGQRLVIPGAAPALAAAPATEAPAMASAQVLAAAGAKPRQPAPGKVEQEIGAQPPTKEEPQRVAEVEPPAARPEVRERALKAEEARKGEQKPVSGQKTPEEVGVKPSEESKHPYVSIFSDVGGILTPRGTLYVEPSVDYSLTSDNRFFFQGVEIIDAVLIGAIEATDSNRRAITEALGLRYGLTSRLEVDGRVSYVRRDDQVTGVAVDDGATTFRELKGDGIGDAEFGVHYQLNRGVNLPYAILNVRAKAPTGESPFDVARDNQGRDTELATGSGYWTIEPSLTLIAPSDPAVVFANVGYQVNMTTKPNAVISASTAKYPTIIREFHPGDAIRTSFGIGLSLNDRASVNFGYDQSYYLATRQLVQTTTENALGDPISHLSWQQQHSTTVGSFVFGGSYAVNDALRLNLNTSIGATAAAPDVQVTLRAQVRAFK